MLASQPQMSPAVWNAHPRRQAPKPELGAVRAGLPTENAINTNITAPVMWSTRETCGEHQTTKRDYKSSSL